MLKRRLTGEVGTAIWTFGIGAILKLGSSMLMTRLLYPEAYGVVTMVVSVLFTIEMLSDLGFFVLIVRQAEAERSVYLDTAWTVKVLRSLFNATLLWFSAPYLAAFFNAPAHTPELRIGCLYILLGGLESFGFLLAIRHQRSRITSVIDLGTTFLSTLFALTFSYYDRSPWGMILGIVVQKGLMAIASYTLVPFHRKVRFRLDKASLKSIADVSKTVVPSSLMTLALTQFDKILLARLLPLESVGIYGIGQNMSGMVEGVGQRLSSSVLFPRFTAMARSAQKPTASDCYSQMQKPILLMLLLPVVVGMHSELIVRILYDIRYGGAGLVMGALCARMFFVNHTLWSAQLLLASGYDRVQGIPPAIRAVTLVVFAYFFYSIFGFNGILLAVALEPLSGLLYVKMLQNSAGLFSRQGELKMLAVCAIAAILSAANAHILTRVIY